MNSMALRMAAAVLLTVCGFCLGDARRQKLTARRRTLEAVTELLTRLRQEIAYRRTDLGQLYHTLATEYNSGSPLGNTFRLGNCFQQMVPPEPLKTEESACFTACFADLGRADAKQECARLDYYLQRFDGFLTCAKEEEQLSAHLDRRLGLAAGAMLGLLML